MTDDLKEQVQHLLSTPIDPAVATHGGRVTLVDVRDGRVSFELGGGCQGCGAAHITLRSGIERLIREEIPGVAEVLDTTDHAAGATPYYRPGK
jgi:Fe/S biogenesis protein NfuA